MKFDFTTIESLLECLEGRETRYEIYIAKEENVVVAMPTVSTRPIKIGVSPFKEGVITIIDKIKKALPIMEGKIFIVDKVDYNIAER